MIALLTEQGTAMAETALCDTHAIDATIRSTLRRAAQATEPLGNQGDFADCTGNDALACAVCGAV